MSEELPCGESSMRVAVLGAGLMGPAIAMDCIESNEVEEVLLIDIEQAVLDRVAENLGNPLKLKIDRSETAQILVALALIAHNSLEGSQFWTNALLGQTVADGPAQKKCSALQSLRCAWLHQTIVADSHMISRLR